VGLGRFSNALSFVVFASDALRLSALLVSSSIDFGGGATSRESKIIMWLHQFNQFNTSVLVEVSN
jgi:hypothetical protein